MWINRNAPAGCRVASADERRRAFATATAASALFPKPASVSCSGMMSKNPSAVKASAKPAASSPAPRM